MRLLRRLRGEERGYSLIELLVVLVILGVVIGGLTTVFVSGSKAELDMNMRFQAQQNARLALGRLRSDIHLAGCATVTSGTTLALYATPSTSACTGTPTATWCTAADQDALALGIANRFALFYGPGTTCDASAFYASRYTASTRLVAGYLTQGSIFTLNVPTTGSKQRTSVALDIRVSTHRTNANLDLYRLQDTIVLRNSPQA